MEDNVMDTGYFYAPYPDLPMPIYEHGDDDTNYPRPKWACPQWGNHEHDWLDCPECNDEYEKYLEQDADEEQ
jgi:hypothetical protein